VLLVARDSLALDRTMAALIIVLDGAAFVLAFWASELPRPGAFPRFFGADLDRLTRLPIRQAFTQTLSDHCRTLEAGAWFHVITLDLDRFKELNDLLGYQGGDRVLVEISRRLQALLPNGAILSRTDGDEFGMAVSGLDEASLQGLIAAIVETAREAIEPAPNTSFKLEYSIGVARAPDDGATGEDLMRSVDAALHLAKHKGRNRIVRIDDPLRSALQRRRVIEAELRKALNAGVLDVHYQPIVNGVTGVIEKVEALARWQHPELGWIPPGEFVPIAEECGLIHRVGQLVLERACTDGAAWPGISISVNISSEQLRRGDLVTVVMDALRLSGLPARQLELEVTETALIGDEAAANAQLRAVQALGIKLALDDFGTGYSSLIYLRRFDFDLLKIDRGFIKDVETEQEASSLVLSIISLAHALGLDVVAEGVETVEQQQFLARAHCNYLQGYLFAKPMPSEALQAMLGRTPEKVAQPLSA